jgi:hypothetical protein
MSRFDVVSVAVFDPIAQSYSREWGPITARIDGKVCFGEVVFLGEAVEKRCHGIRAAMLKTAQSDRDSEQDRLPQTATGSYHLY